MESNTTLRYSMLPFNIKSYKNISASSNNTDSSAGFTQHLVSTSPSYNLFQEKPNGSFLLYLCHPDMAAPQDSAHISSTLKLIFSLGILFVMLIGFTGNLVICLMLYYKPVMRSAINILLANIAISDITMSIVCMPASLLFMILDDCVPGPMLCKIVGFVHLMMVSIAIFVLLAISFDRYLIIVRRQNKLSQIKAKVMIVGSWSLALAIAFPPLITNNHYQFCSKWMLKLTQDDCTYNIWVAVLVYILPAISMVYIYASILNTVRNNRIKIHNYSDSFSHVQLASGARLRCLHIDMSFKTKAFKTILIIFLVFLLTFTPYATYGLVMSMNCQGDSLTSALVLWIGYSNCALHPIIYSICIKKFRDACKEYFPKPLRQFSDFPYFVIRRLSPGSFYRCPEECEISTG